MAIQRITGTNSGLDVDALVKASLTTYQNKIDKETQNKKILEYQQEQYKQIISDATDFYDKYCDILKTGNLISTKTYNTVSFTSSDGDTSKVTAKGFAGASVDNYTVSVTQLASKATTKFSQSDLNNKVASGTGNTSGLLYVNMGAIAGGSDVYVDIAVTEKKESDGTYKDASGTQIYQQSDGSFAYDLAGTLKLKDGVSAKPQYVADLQKTVENLNNKLAQNNINITAKYSEYSGGIVLESGQLGSSVKFSAMIASTTTNEKASDLTTAEKATIVSTANSATNSYIKTGTDLQGTIKKIGSSDSDYVLKGNSNTVTVDNVQFSLKATTAGVTLTGATNVTDIKDKIVKFVDDYNTLLQSINTKIFETRDKDYMPLTDAQKEEMTDSQIAAWEKKAQTGLLRKDSDLQRIANKMKSAMSTVMSGSGSYLEKIGISPVKNYAEKNGILTVDENKLTQALEDNAANVKDLLTRAASTTSTTDKGGILTQLSSTLKSEFKTSTSSLSKKAGSVGSSTEYDNILTKSIYNKKQLIATLNSSLTQKENALYKKYSALETAMGKLNSQQSSLTSMLGQN